MPRKNSKRLTEIGIDKLPAAPKGKRVEHFDSGEAGLALRITDKGTKSWIVYYYMGPRHRKMTLGRYPDLGIAEARQEACRATSQARRGIDPVLARDETKRQERAANYLTFENLAGDYIKFYAKPYKKTWRDDERFIQKELLPNWGSRPAVSITKDDVRAIISAVYDRGSPYSANRLLALIRKLFAWAVDEIDEIPSSPAAGVKRRLKKEIARDRILSDVEIAQVWQAWDQQGGPFGPVFQLLLVTGQRLSEVAGVRWSDLDLEGRHLWTLPREKTKSDRLHEVPLSSLAVEIIEAQPRTSEFVFSVNGKRPVSGFYKVKNRTDEISGVTNWRLHDLRRTCASGMARLKTPPHVVEKVLNHETGSISGVAAVYNRHGYDTEKRDALNAWARQIETILGRSVENVVALHA